MQPEKPSFGGNAITNIVTVLCTIRDNMRRTRALLKYTLRSCKQNEELIRNDKLANHLSELNMIDFWKQIKRMNNSKSVQANCIDGVTGEQNIAEHWKSYYENIFNCISDVSNKEYVLSDLNTCSGEECLTVTADEVDKIICNLKKSKAVGPDNLTSESLIYANFNISIILSMCFNTMLKHSYMPASLLESVIVPLVKNKCGNLSDSNNYRPIAIANCISKVFEGVLLNRLEEFLWTCDSQFGFKPGHSTDMSVYILHEFIDYYKQKSTSVFVTFLDASKAFDKINHWTLFRKLIDRHVPLYLVKILLFWYHHQTMCVRWGNSISSHFFVRNGVKQGGILSPRLFNVYINDLCVKLYDL